MKKKVNSPFLGEIEIDEDRIIYLPHGMIGFNDYKKYLLLEDGEIPFWYLQSVEDENLFFILVNPLRFFPDYKVEIEKEKLSDIKLTSPEQGAVLCPVTIPEGGVDNATANLKGPVIINTEKGLAVQLVLHPSDYTTKHPLFSKTPETKKASGED